MSIEDQKKLENIYLEQVMIEMDCASIFGIDSTHGGELENGDNYAPGDTRIPKVLGKVQTRRGTTGKKNKKGIKNKSKSRS